MNLSHDCFEIISCNPPKQMKRKRGQEGKKSTCLLYAPFLKKPRKENPMSREMRSW